MIKNVFTGRVLTLNLETVTLPNGVTVELEVVRHPGAAAMVPLKEDGTVILIRQFRLAAGGFIYEIPAGKLQPGEDPKLCAERELIEEIGQRATRIEKLSTFFTAPGFTDETMHLFKCTGLVPATQNLDHDEVLEIVEMPLEQAIELVRDGSIRDAKSMIGLMTVYLDAQKPR